MALELPYFGQPGAPSATPFSDIYNRLSESALKRRQMELANQYYGPTAEANALSKMAYAQFAGPEAIQKLLNTPNVASQLTPEQYRSLVQRGHQGIMNAPNINLPSSSMASSGLGEYLMNLALGKINSKNQQQNMLPKESINGLLNPPSFSNQVSNEENIENLPKKAPSSTISRLSQIASGDTGAIGGENPAAIYNAQQKALDTLATGEASAQNTMWKQIHTDVAKSAMGAQDNINLLDKFNDAYSRLNKWERGPLAGRGPALSGAAQDTDATANAIADSVARAQQKGHITVTDRQTYTSMKPGRHMTPEAKEHQVEFIKGMNERIGEEPAFYIKAQELGLNPQQANAVWSYYIKNKPFYDAKKRKVIDENIDSWEEFLTPKKINEALNPKQRQRIQSKPSQNQSFNRIIVRSPDGKLGSIRESDWQEAQQAGYKRV